MSWINRANRILDRYNLKIERISQFEKLRDRCFRAKKDRFFFVQIGANDGVRYDDLYYFVTKRRCQGIVVEPIKEFFSLLKENYRYFPEVIPVNCAIHPTEKEAELYRVDPSYLLTLPHWSSGISSFFEDHHAAGPTPSESIIREKVSCVSMSQLLGEYNVSHIELLQIDVEGFDAEVVKMIDFSKIKPLLIKYEHSNLNQQDVVNTSQLLKSEGYTVFEEGNDTIAYLEGSF